MPAIIMAGDHMVYIHTHSLVSSSIELLLLFDLCTRSALPLCMWLISLMSKPIFPTPTDRSETD